MRKRFMDTRDLYLVCVNGGRQGGATERMLHAIAQGSHKVRDTHPEWNMSVGTLFIHLHKYEWDIPMLVDPEMQKPKDKIEHLLTRITSADGLILTTPVHWSNMSALMSRMLAWFYYLEEEEEAGWPLEAMPVVYGACGNIDGAQAAVNAMQNVMMHLKCMTPPDGHFYINSEVPSGKESKWMNEDARLAGLRLAEAAAHRKYGL